MSSGEGRGDGARSFAIVGAGSLGLVLAAGLAAAGHAVTLLVRPGAEATLLDEGSVQVTGALDVGSRLVTDPGEPGVVTVATELGEHGHDHLDLLIFATKAHQLEDAVTEMVKVASLPPTVSVAGFQNGVAKDDVLRSAFGPGSLICAATVLNARRTGTARATVAGLGMSYFGEPSGPASERVEAICHAFQAAGFPAVAVQNGTSMVWAKFANAIGVFGVTSLTRLATGDMMHRRPLVLAYRSLLEEVDAVARAEGVAIGDYPGLTIGSYLTATPDELADQLTAGPYDPAAPPSLSSMLQDITAQRRTEVDQTFGDLIRRARSHDVPVPRAELVNALISGIGSEK